MFVRLTPYKLKPGEKAAAIETMESLKPRITALEGMVEFLNIMQDDENGHVVSVVESEEISNANGPAVQALWGEFAKHLAEMPTPVGCEVVARWT